MADDDTRRYCLTCSAKSPRLVERVCPVLEDKRKTNADKRKEKSAEERARIRAKNDAAEQAKQAQRLRLGLNVEALVAALIDQKDNEPNKVFRERSDRVIEITERNLRYGPGWTIARALFNTLSNIEGAQRKVLETAEKRYGVRPKGVSNRRGLNRVCDLLRGPLDDWFNRHAAYHHAIRIAWEQTSDKPSIGSVGDAIDKLPRWTLEQQHREDIPSVFEALRVAFPLGESDRDPRSLRLFRELLVVPPFQVKEKAS